MLVDSLAMIRSEGVRVPEISRSLGSAVAIFLVFYFNQRYINRVIRDTRKDRVSYDGEKEKIK